jgi:hypothetical protein
MHLNLTKVTSFMVFTKLTGSGFKQAINNINSTKYISPVGSKLLGGTAAASAVYTFIDFSPSSIFQIRIPSWAKDYEWPKLPQLSVPDNLKNIEWTKNLPRLEWAKKIPENLPVAIPENLPVGIPENLPVGIPEYLPVGIPENFTIILKKIGTFIINHLVGSDSPFLSIITMLGSNNIMGFVVFSGMAGLYALYRWEERISADVKKLQEGQAAHRLETEKNHKETTEQLDQIEIKLDDHALSTQTEFGSIQNKLDDHALSTQTEFGSIQNQLDGESQSVQIKFSEMLSKLHEQGLITQIEFDLIQNKLDKQGQIAQIGFSGIQTQLEANGLTAEIQLDLTKSVYATLQALQGACSPSNVVNSHRLAETVADGFNNSFTDVLSDRLLAIQVACLPTPPKEPISNEVSIAISNEVSIAISNEVSIAIPNLAPIAKHSGSIDLKTYNSITNLFSDSLGTELSINASKNSVFVPSIKEDYVITCLDFFINIL